jgi:hypothetical protein
MMVVDHVCVWVETSAGQCRLATYPVLQILPELWECYRKTDYLGRSIFGVSVSMLFNIYIIEVGVFFFWNRYRRRIWERVCHQFQLKKGKKIVSDSDSDSMS